MFVRSNVIPKGMTVTKAAEALGVGRPALSNFLNGNSSLSDDMAERLRKTFGANRDALLEMQRRFDALAGIRSKKKTRAPRPAAAQFAKITARDIERWVDRNIEARQLLPVLIRRLASTTGVDIEKIDFPGYDNSERSGWDGFIIAASASGWVPAGRSGWEFGCNADPQKKANDDFKNRRGIADQEKADTTYVQVSPRNWSGKEKWAAERRAEGAWKDVIALDASDLEQWMEHSVATQIWFGRKIGKPVDARALPDYWDWWAGATSPAISPKIFESSIAQFAAKIISWLDNPGLERPFVVAAASKEEACAFIAAAAQSDNRLIRLFDQGAFVESAKMTRDLMRMPSGVIPITTTPEAEAELVSSHKVPRHAIVVTELNSVLRDEPDIRVDLPNSESFRKALHEMLCDDAEIDRLAGQSGRSPTILRRLRARSPGLAKPAWADDVGLRAKLVPYVLVGAWDNSLEADQAVIQLLAAANSIDEVDADVAVILDRDDAPLWAEDSFRGVVSKLDCLNAVAGQITPSVLNTFFDIARYVLSEDDPALDLEKEKRWAASLYEKVRAHSAALRNGVADSLIMLAVHGDRFLGQRLDYKISDQIEGLVRNLLLGKTPREWQALRRDLPTLAEAAPDEFLDVLESELRAEAPAFACLFEPVDGSAIFGECQRTGILWALELLAWSPDYLPRVIDILAELCRFELHDNWVNKPERTLNELLLFWLPQTAATVDQRCKAIDRLCESHPDVGWRVCVAQIGQRLNTVSTSYRPDWRGYASGSRRPTNAEIYKFLRHCREKLLAWRPQTEETLSDLISCFQVLSDEDRAEVTELVRSWLEDIPPENEIANLREKVRRQTRTYRARVNARKREARGGVIDGSELYELLQPKDPIQKHKWLFEKDWVEFSGDDLEEERLDFHERERRISEARDRAISEVYKTRGIDGVVELSGQCDGTFSIGAAFARVVDTDEALTDLVLRSVTVVKRGHDRKLSGLLQGILRVGLGENQFDFLDDLLSHLRRDGNDLEAQSIVLQHASFERATWDRVKNCNMEVQESYWTDVAPSWGPFERGDLDYLIRELMKAERPRAAFHVAHLEFKDVGTAVLMDLVDGIGASTGKNEEFYVPRNHEISDALKSLSKRSDIDRHRLLGLEFVYVEALTPGTDYEFPELMREIADSPESFAQLLAMAFRRKDHVEDWAEWNLPEDQESRQVFAKRAYATLRNANRIPGTNDEGVIDVAKLRDWVAAVRAIAAKHDRVEIADQEIGKLLSRCKPDDEDGLWPCKPVRIVLEEFHEEDISIGMHIGRFNQSGAEFRTVDSERELRTAAQYRENATKVIDEYPFTGRILMNLAKSYERDAERWDSDDRVRRRLRQ